MAPVPLAECECEFVPWTTSNSGPRTSVAAERGLGHRRSIVGLGPAANAVRAPLVLPAADERVGDLTDHVVDHREDHLLDHPPSRRGDEAAVGRGAGGGGHPVDRGVTRRRLRIELDHAHAVAAGANEEELRLSWPGRALGRELHRAVVPASRAPGGRSQLDRLRLAAGRQPERLQRPCREHLSDRIAAPGARSVAAHALEVDVHGWPTSSLSSAELDVRITGVARCPSPPPRSTGR